MRFTTLSRSHRHAPHITPTRRGQALRHVTATQQSIPSFPNNRRAHTHSHCMPGSTRIRTLHRKPAVLQRLTSTEGCEHPRVQARARGYSGRELGRANRFSSSISSAFALVARKTASGAQLARAARDAPCSGLRRDRPLSCERGHCGRRTRRSRRMRIGSGILLGRAMPCVLTKATRSVV